MNNNLEQEVEEIEKTPHQLASDRMDIANSYMEKGKRMAKIKKMKAEWWKLARENFKSDASADRAWDLLPEGDEMETLRLEMKGMEMQMSAIKTMLMVNEMEAKNFY